MKLLIPPNTIVLSCIAAYEDRIPKIFTHHNLAIKESFKKLKILIFVGFAQWQYHSRWGSSEAWLLLIENYTQCPALSSSNEWLSQFVYTSTEVENRTN